MTVFLFHTFLCDLREVGEANFAQRVLRKVLSSSGEFREDSDDHRYLGIEDAWIRYVSAGKTAFRAIYLRKDADIYLYRAGPHSIEDNLAAPPALGTAVKVVPAATSSGPSTPNAASFTTANRYLQNGRQRLLSTFLLGRRLVPHSEIMLMSPFVSLPLLQRSTRLGRALDDLIEEGTKVTLITRWPTASELDQWRSLEARGFDLLFHRRLHAKLYIFAVRPASNNFGPKLSNSAVLGSANLTEKGFGFDEQSFNEELCYELPESAHERAWEFATQIATDAADLTKVRRDLIPRR